MRSRLEEGGREEGGRDSEGGGKDPPPNHTVIMMMHSTDSSPTERIISLWFANFNVWTRTRTIDEGSTLPATKLFQVSSSNEEIRHPSAGTSSADDSDGTTVGLGPA